MTLSPTRDAEFEKLFIAHRDAIWAYCYRRLPPDEVPDAVAETFSIVWRKVDALPEDTEAILWTYGIARNVVRSFKRSAMRRTRLNDRLMSLREPGDYGPDVSLVSLEQDRTLLEAVSDLRPIEQELLRLRTWEELSLAEISEVTGISVRGVESRLARIRKKLGTSLSRHESKTWWSPTRQTGGER